MSLHVRRVVTGHDAQGRAVVTHDETTATLPPRRPGQEACVVWADQVPADNLAAADGSQHSTETHLPGGAIFRVVRYAAGTSGRMHRTRTLDYGVVMSGSIQLQLDDTAVTLHAGDVLVQRGTIHNWVNQGSADCTIAFVLLDALDLRAA